MSYQISINLARALTILAISFQTSAFADARFDNFCVTSPGSAKVVVYNDLALHRYRKSDMPIENGERSKIDNVFVYDFKNFENVPWQHPNGQDCMGHCWGRNSDKLPEPVYYINEGRHDRVAEFHEFYVMEKGLISLDGKKTDKYKDRNVVVKGGVIKRGKIKNDEKADEETADGENIAVENKTGKKTLFRFPFFIKTQALLDKRPIEFKSGKSNKLIFDGQKVDSVHIRYCGEAAD
jgi:hypothetical protein